MLAFCRVATEVDVSQRDGAARAIKRCNVWNHVYHTPATISEEVGVDRVIVTLPYGGNEQDVKAMLELYDNPEELMFPEGEQELVLVDDVGGHPSVTVKQSFL